RFWELDRTHQDALRAMKLLTAAGILSLSHARVLAVLQHVFDLTPSRLADLLEELADNAFLRRPHHQDPVQPEPAYLERCVAYTEQRAPEDDFGRLQDVLAKTEDADGLFALGLTHAIRDLYTEALACCTIASDLRPSHPDTRFLTGMIL